ncbi:MAG: endonuclease/exonuclease/phosphatase family protein [Candidatus Saccharimonadales bacterium]
MTYNILDGGGNRLDLIAKVINNAHPDIITINEANGFNEDNGQKLKRLSQKTGLPYYHLALSGEYDYHVAVISKIPFKARQEVHPLMRAGIIVVVETEFGDVSICGTHLTPYSEAQRIPEIRLIIDSQKKYKNRVLMGDMNSLSSNDGYPSSMPEDFNESQLKKFTKDKILQFQVTNTINTAKYIDVAIKLRKQADKTAPTSSNQDVTHASTRLDYIFVSTNLESHIASYQVIKDELTERASDHYPVLVELS